MATVLRCLMVALVLAAPAARADEPKGGKAAHPLVGTWKLVSAKYNGREPKFPEGTTTLKHVTGSQFMWVSYDKDGKVFRTAGGTYAVKGEGYEETLEYGLGDLTQLEGEVIGRRSYSDGLAEALERFREGTRRADVNIPGWAGLEAIAQLQSEAAFEHPLAVCRQPSQ